MEVADQWRREWAGTAEYGKLVEGGVTRQIARAMEVLHASGPGARVRVMRAAFHSSAGPGAPASSYMVHSSRRVISSGFIDHNFMDPPSLPSRPLEISSMPLELSQDSPTETENYKVTEPDDTEISEPSKWRSSLGSSRMPSEESSSTDNASIHLNGEPSNWSSLGSSRMPSEESSSTDNASIINLDSRTKQSFRKYSYDSENSDIPISSSKSSRVSPLIDAPVPLSSLKFKSLINSNSDWNNRRKSYSFEDTSPITESIMYSNDTLALESSTDSGICKSTEIVNDNVDENKYKYLKPREKSPPSNSFQNWLANNRQNNRYSDPRFKSNRHRESIRDDHAENNISLQSKGKVSITLPIAIETDEGYVYKNNQMNDENRKVKKVEFCKTELHFAAETGRVNIISTDDKPPPTNDFRKRRSAFVPLRDISEKPITLFGEKPNELLNEDMDSYIYKMNDLIENDENTAATKSILKNKIPKPKPYLLGENMEFGIQKEYDIDQDTDNVSTGVSLINKQLQADKWCDTEITKISQQETSSLRHNSFQTINQGLCKNNVLGVDIYGSRDMIDQKTEDSNNVSSVRKVHAIKTSPTPGRIKTRELKESDLTYFGVRNPQNNDISIKTQMKRSRETLQDSTNLFQSVKLIQQVSNSVCNSESEDSPEYQNIPFNKNNVPKPTPRIRSKFDDKPNQIEEIKVTRPTIERAKEVKIDDSSLTRRSRVRKLEELKSLTNRSRSEPRKSQIANFIEASHSKADQPQRSSDNSLKKNKSKSTTHNTEKAKSDDDTPVYENLKKYVNKNASEYPLKSAFPRSSNLRQSLKKSHSSKITQNNDVAIRDTNSKTQKSITSSKDKNVELKKEIAKKTATVGKEKSDVSNNSIITESTQNVKRKSHKSEPQSINIHDSLSSRKERKSRSLQRQDKILAPERKSVNKTERANTSSEKDKNDQSGEYNVYLRHSSKDKTNSRIDTSTIMPKVVQNSSTNKQSSRESARLGSRSKRNEYVINYDDKNGTVSSIKKIRSNSDSPKRKPTKDIVKEKYKEISKNKTSDKVALRK